MHTQKELEQLVQDVKRDTMIQVIMALRHHTMTQAKARQLAKDFMEIFPVYSANELLAKLKSLGKLYPEVFNIFLKYVNRCLEHDKQEKLEKASVYIAQKDIDQALSILKGEYIHG